MFPPWNLFFYGDWGRPHLSGEQRFALQKAFLRQIRMGVPRGFYRLSDTKEPWHTGTSQGQLFHRPCIFHAAAPMNRYIAPLLATICEKWGTYGRNTCFSQIALAIGVLTSNRRGGWLPTLAGFTLGAIAECHCWGAIAGCHCEEKLTRVLHRSPLHLSLHW